MRELGVRRVSLGSSVMLATYAFTRRALQQVNDKGIFTYTQGSLSYAEMTQLLTKYSK